MEEIPLPTNTKCTSFHSGFCFNVCMLHCLKRLLPALCSSSEQQKPNVFGPKVIPVSSARCAVITSIPAGGVGEFQCNGMDGRYVNVVVPREEFLSLCEVEVYGSPLD